MLKRVAPWLGWFVAAVATFANLWPHSKLRVRKLIVEDSGDGPKIGLYVQDGNAFVEIWRDGHSVAAQIGLNGESPYIGLKSANGNYEVVPQKGELALRQIGPDGKVSRLGMLSMPMIGRDGVFQPFPGVDSAIMDRILNPGLTELDDEGLRGIEEMGGSATERIKPTLKEEDWEQHMMK